MDVYSIKEEEGNPSLLINSLLTLSSIRELEDSFKVSFKLDLFSIKSYAFPYAMQVYAHIKSDGFCDGRVSFMSFRLLPFPMVYVMLISCYTLLLEVDP